MSIRSFAASTVTIAALSALPATAVAYPVRDSVAPASAVAATPDVQQSAPDSTGGTGTLVVVGIAGATLLVGAAGGFEGGRIRTRRHSMG